MAISAARHSSSAAAWAASSRLTSAASSLTSREQRLLLLALRAGDLLAALLLLGPAGLEVGDRRAPRGVRGERPVDDVVGQATLGLGGTDAVRVVTEDARVDHGVRLVGAGDLTPPGGRSARRPGPVVILGPVLDRPRRLTLAWSVACFVLFGVLALLAVARPDAAAGLRRPRTRRRGLGRRPRRPDRGAAAGSRLATATIAMTVLTVLVAGLLLLRRHTRARRSTSSP